MCLSATEAIETSVSWLLLPIGVCKQVCSICLSRFWGLCYNLITECQCKCVREPGSSLGQEEMCDHRCDIAMFTCGTEGQKQKTAFNCLASFSSPPRWFTPSSGHSRLFFLHADTKHNNTRNLAHTFLGIHTRLWWSWNQLCLPSMALPGAITSKLCNNPKKSNPVANVLVVVRNIVAYLERIAISHQSPLGSCQAGGCRQATTCNRAQAMMLLTGKTLSGCATTLTGMLLAAHTENNFCSLSRQKKKN